MNTTVCDGPNCDARLLWAITTSGKRQPLDAEPNDDGNTILIKRALGEPLGMSTAKLPEETRRALREGGVAFYTPHHATCPDVGRFRT